MSRHVPGALHPPDTEGVAEPLVGHVAAAGREILELGRLVVTSEDLEKEVDVSAGQLQSLDLAELV